MSLRERWSQRTRTLRGREAREYEQFWVEWHAKYDSYTTTNRAHRINGTRTIPSRALTCICGDEFYGAPEEALLRAFQAHIDENQPRRIDVGQASE